MKRNQMKVVDAWNKAKSSAKDALNVSLLLGAVTAAAPAVLAADGEDKAKSVISAILTIVYLITNVLGIIFVIVGFVKLVISHAQEDAPGQQKASMFIATGLVLILVRFVMKLIKFEDWIDLSAS